VRAGRREYTSSRPKKVPSPAWGKGGSDHSADWTVCGRRGGRPGATSTTTYWANATCDSKRGGKGKRIGTETLNVSDSISSCKGVEDGLDARNLGVEALEGEAECREERQGKLERPRGGRQNGTAEESVGIHVNRPGSTLRKLNGKK